MKIKLTINVYSEADRTGITYEKTYESTALPSLGAKVKDGLFAELKKIIEIIVDYENETATITLEPKELPSDRFEGHIQEVAQMHSWIEVK